MPNFSRNAVVIAGVALAVVVIGVIIALATRSQKSATPATPTAVPTVTVAPTVQATSTITPTASPTPNATATALALVPGPLDGEPTHRYLTMRRPMGIMVENFAPDARPQTGLLQASVVFETEAEFGITRFLAVYQENEAPLVGPVRSARVYYDHWANGWHVIFVHAGGNADALNELWNLHGLFDVNEVKWEVNLQPTGIDFFKRIPRQGAAIEHTMYTYPQKVYNYVASQGHWITGESPAHLAFKTPAPVNQRPSGGTIDIGFSGPDYAVRYVYDPKTNTYLRYMGSGLPPHLDADGKTQIAPSNVVVMMANQHPDPAGDSPGSIIVQSEGTNTAYYFMDGQMFKGTWSKPKVSDPLQLLDAHGAQVRLNPGQTWIEAVPIGSPFSYNVLPAPTAVPGASQPISGTATMTGTSTVTGTTALTGTAVTTATTSLTGTAVTTATTSSH